MTTFYDCQSKAERECRYLTLRALAREIRERAERRKPEPEKRLLRHDQIDAREDLAALVGASKAQAEEDAPPEED